MLKKIEIIFFLLCVVLVVFVILPTVNNFTNCFSFTAGQIQSNTESYKSNKPTQEQFCQEGQKMILSLDSCLQKVKEQNIFASLIFNLTPVFFPKTKNNAIETIDRHNQVCPQYSVPQIF